MSGDNAAVATDPVHRRAVLMLLATAILWSLGGLLIKWVDWNPVAIAGVRSLIGAAVIALIFRNELKFSGSFEQIGAAVAYAGTVVLFVVANKLTTAANAILLQYTAPVYVALFSPWFLGERARGNDWLSLAVIMLGMLLFFGDELSLDGYLGNGVALASGFCFAWLTLFLRRHREESAMSALVLGNLLAGLIGLPFMFQSVPDATGWVGTFAARRGATRPALCHVRTGAAACSSGRRDFDPDDRAGAQSAVGVPAAGRNAGATGVAGRGDHSGRGAV